MPEFFHVDRSRTLNVGATLDLDQRTDLHPPDLQPIADDLFPNGMTNHGWQYLWHRASQAADVMTEVLFEYVRRAEFPERPSRFTSYFAFETIEDAKTFRLRYPTANGVQGTIFVVQADTFFRCNMALLDPGANAVITIGAARAYWSGERGSAEELWEVLLSPPLTLLGAAE